jgi:hypothetical protein
MTRRGRGGGRSREGGIRRAVRGALLLGGLAALLGGLGWTTASVMEPLPESELARLAELQGVSALGSGDFAPQCLSPREVAAVEGESCVLRAYRDLLAGWLEPDEALRRMRDCGDASAALVAALSRSEALGAEERRARVAFGYPVSGADSPDVRGEVTYAGTGARGRDAAAASARAVARLKAAGIDPLAIQVEAGELRRRMLTDRALLRDVGEVFGPTTAEGMERLIVGGATSVTASSGVPPIGDPRAGRAVPALRIGNTVLLPRLHDPMDENHPISPPLLVGGAEYDDELLHRLHELERARERYLSAAGFAHRLTGSVARFLAELPGGPAVDDRFGSSAVTAERARVELLEVLAGVEEELGADPAVVQLARERVAAAIRLDQGCGAAALRRARMVRAGAGVVTGLTGGSAVVVAAGATGTLLGGVTIAAAVQAVGGSYLTYRSELATAASVAATLPFAAPEPVDPERERVERLAGSESLLRGEEGRGAGDFLEELVDGEWREIEGAAGEGEQMEVADGHTAPEPRESTVPAELPAVPEEEALRLPPMLEALRAGELPRLTLAEAQQRIDEFLALETRARPRDTGRDEPVRSASRSELIEEARASLALWVERRELASGFATFFVRAEAEDLPAPRREAVLLGAMDRWERDRAVYRSTADLDQLRTRVAERLVVHCRGGADRGDLILQACSDPTALTLVVVGAVHEAAVAIPPGLVLGVQAIGPDFHPIVFDPQRREVTSLLTGETTTGVTAPLYHPASFFYGFLVENGVRPEIDVEAHLLIAAPDAGMASAAPACGEPRSRNIFTRLGDWVRSVFGRQIPSRRGAACGGDGVPSRSESDPGVARESGGGVQVTLTRPGVPVISGGSGRPGGGSGGGGGGGGGSEGGSPAGSAGASAGGRSGSDGERGGGAERGGATGDQTTGSGAAGGERSAGQGEGAGGGSDGRGGSGQGDGNGSDRRPAGADGGSAGGTPAGSGGAGSGGEAGRYIPGAHVDLIAVAGEAQALARAAREEGNLRVRGWRLRENHSFTPPSARVMYADNEHARARFRPEDRFITMSPSLVEEQRRMFEADSFPIFPLATDCSAAGLPPRRVFRRATGVGDGVRYVFCDHDESMVAFRERADAASYARLGAPDRPLLLARFASERIEHFQNSEEIRAIHAFLRDPEVILDMRVEKLDSLINAAVELLWFQETLEATLFLSMTELEGSPLRGYYYDLNRQVAQSPFLVEWVEAIHRFNHRLASDPLRSLAWANALPPEHRRRFFSLYYTLGAPMGWPARWEALHRRYGGGGVGSPLPPMRRDEPSPDFLQVTSDPTRVRIDWTGEHPEARPSIHDREERDGTVRTRRVVAEATDATELERQETVRRLRAGTGGLGRSGEGEGVGPERGRRPLQMIRIRMVPETGDPDPSRIPERNTTRPGGTEGERRVQERSASRQEPVLWLPPETFIDAILSAWDPPRERPAEASRVPPALRFNARLRAIFLDDPDEDDVYEARLANAMGVLVTGGWLDYVEVRRALGGSFQGVRAHDLGRYAAEYARNAAIVDQAQVRGLNFFTRSSIAVPADLVGRVRHGFSRHGTGNFDLHLLREPPARPLPPPDPDVPGATEAREALLRSLEMVRERERAAN